MTYSVHLKKSVIPHHHSKMFV